jgi:hypothetical protein
VRSGLLTKCSKLLVEGNDAEDNILDNMSARECDMTENRASQQEVNWEFGGNRKSKKRATLQATRQSPRLKTMRGY